MAFGVTPDGFVRKRFEDIESGIGAYLRSKISKHLQLTEKTGLGNVVKSVSDQLAEAWEALEGAYYSNDAANADDASKVALAELTGTRRRGPQFGFVTATCNFAANKTYAPSVLVAHVDGQSSNRWVNRDEVVTTAAGDYPVVFKSETPGAHAVAQVGTLTKIAQAIDGWNSVVNDNFAATPGEDEESIEDLEVRREIELEGSGSGPLPAIVAAVQRVSGVVSVKGLHNRTSTNGVNGLPAHSFRIIVWDGTSPAADDDEIAQAIFDNAPAGIEYVGTKDGNAVDIDGNVIAIKFDRATQVPIWIYVETVGGTSGICKADLVAFGATLGIGSTVVYEKLKAVATNSAGVTDLLDFLIGTSDPPLVTTNIPMAVDAIPLFDAVRIEFEN